MKYSDDEAIREIVQRGRSVRDRRMYGRMCALGGLSVGLAVALLIVLLTGIGVRMGNNGGSGDIALVSTTQASPSEEATPGGDVTEEAGTLPPVELAEGTEGVPASEDGQVPGGDIPGGTPVIGGNPALPPTQQQPGEKDWIDKEWELQTAALSVLKLETYDAKGDRICSGSGFVIYDRQYLVTACHVVVNMDHLVATTDWGETFEVHDVIAVDQDQDIAVLRITQLPEDIQITPLKPVDGIPLKGRRVVAIGSQFGVVNMITTGMLSGYWVNGDYERILFTAPVASGSSGGPLFDDHGYVIGVISGTYDGGQNLNLAVPIENVYRLLESEMEVK